MEVKYDSCCNWIIDNKYTIEGDIYYGYRVYKKEECDEYNLKKAQKPVQEKTIKESSNTELLQTLIDKRYDELRKMIEGNIRKENIVEYENLKHPKPVFESSHFEDCLTWCNKNNNCCFK